MASWWWARAAAPFVDGGELRGVHGFDVASVAEARALTGTDRAMRVGRLVMARYSGYGAVQEANAAPEDRRRHS